MCPPWGEISLHIYPFVVSVYTYQDHEVIPCHNPAMLQKAFTHMLKKKFMSTIVSSFPAVKSSPGVNGLSKSNERTNTKRGCLAFAFPGDFGSGGRAGGGVFGGPSSFGQLFDNALIWCSTSHAHHIAKQEGIDLRDIKFEHISNGGINVIVDAPNATPLQIELLGQRVQEECPVARFCKTHTQSPAHKMRWLQLPRK